MTKWNLFQDWFYNQKSVNEIRQVNELKENHVIILIDSHKESD